MAIFNYGLIPILEFIQFYMYAEILEERNEMWVTVSFRRINKDLCYAKQYFKIR